jgi:hypothetical protein
MIPGIVDFDKLTYGLTVKYGEIRISKTYLQWKPTEQKKALFFQEILASRKVL